ncbi:MAG: hypothetical protein AAFQ52_09060 [Chloroflexota bacterium]
MTLWHSLFISSPETTKIATIIDSFATEQGYKRYDPFTGLPGMTYPHTLKIFVAPSHIGWTRIILDSTSQPDVYDALAKELSSFADCLAVRLSSKQGRVTVYRAGEVCELEAWATKHGADSTQTLSDALQKQDLAPASDGTIGTIAVENLPPDMREMVGKVNAKQANKLFEKLAKRFLSAGDRLEAQALLNQQPDWDSEDGRYIRAVMAYLTVGDAWRTPDFADIRSAYLAHSTGEKTSIANIADYTPIYAGKLGG